MDVVSNILFGLLVAYALAFLWQALYASETVEPEVTVEQMITYAVLGSVITTSLQTGTVYFAVVRIRWRSAWSSGGWPTPGSCWR